MEKHFYFLRQTRNNLIKFIDGFTTEQLNKIPEGFSNNLIWNIGHCVITQQILCYKLTNNTPNISEFLVDRFRKGSQPSQVSSEEIIELKTLLISTVDQLEKDYSNGIFKSFEDYETSYGVVLSTIEEAITFNNVHEALHIGYCMALRKSL